MSAVLAGLIVVLYRDRRRAGRADPPLPARLRLHRAGDRRRRGHAGVAAGPRRRPALGADGGRAARHRRDGRLPAGRDRARAGPGQVRPRGARPRPFRRPRAEAARPDVGRQVRVHPAHSARTDPPAPWATAGSALVPGDESASCAVTFPVKFKVKFTAEIQTRNPFI